MNPRASASPFSLLSNSSWHTGAQAAARTRTTTVVVGRRILEPTHRPGPGRRRRPRPMPPDTPGYRPPSPTCCSCGGACMSSRRWGAGWRVESSPVLVWWGLSRLGEANKQTPTNKATQGRAVRAVPRGIEASYPCPAMHTEDLHGPHHESCPLVAIQ